MGNGAPDASGEVPRLLRVSAAEHGMFRAGARVAVAVSGGADSMCALHVLARLAHEFGISLCVAHLNHGVRGAEADTDQEFVRESAGRIGFDFYTEKLDIPALYSPGGPSMEMLCRRERMAFFERARRALNADVIATGHTMSDQAETVLLRMIRGTSPHGLAGMKHVNGTIVRPLLCVSRAQVRDYCRFHRIEFREDITNEEESILRNRVRRSLLPFLEKEFNPRAQNHLFDLAELARRDAEFIDELAIQEFNRALIHNANEQLMMRLDTLSALHDAILSRVLAAAFYQAAESKDVLLTGEHIRGVTALVRGGHSGQCLTLPGEILVTREPGALVFHAAHGDAESIEFEYTIRVPEPGDENYTRLNPPGINLELRLLTEIPDNVSRNDNPFTAYLDASKTGPEMTIRNWRPGDRFQPLGMKGTKKLQDYFTDTRVSRAQRKSAAVLLIGDKIAWVVGHRIDDGFKVTKHTKCVLFIKADF